VLANLLDWPAGVLTAGKAEKAADAAFRDESAVYKPMCKFVCVCERRDGGAS
jgi:hypothetical protein